jgi:chemotaxis protein MotB
MIAAVSLSLACVSTGKYEMALQERDELAREHRALQDEYESTKQGLEAEKARLESDIMALEDEKRRLEEERGQLEGRVGEMEADVRGLGTQLEQQKQEAARFKATYDGLVGQLKNELAAGQIEIRQLRDGLSVDVAQEILFESGSAELDDQGREVLLKVSEQLEKTPYQIVVGGHTDDRQIGPNLAKRYPTNWELAGARSASVVRLFEESGIDGKRLFALSFGKYTPRDSNETPEGRARNRRIEIRMRPVTPEEG